MEISSPLGTDSRIINPLLAKLVRTRWLDTGLVLFLRVYRPRLRLGPGIRGLWNGPIQFKNARTIWPLLELLAKIS